MVTACEGGLTQQGKDEIISQFWSVWLEHEEKLYHCCLKLMNGNSTEAEDALSSAKIKAWEKVQEFAGSIRNLKAWLMQLTSNLCKDILDKNSRGPAAVENIELVGETGVLCTASGVATPMMVLEMEETYVAIRRAVASLPQGQRDTFVLHYYERLKHKEIVERLGITYNSVCKRISLAREQLKGKLRSYFCDEKELERALEPKLPKSPTPQGRAKKRKIESCGSKGSKGKELATVSTATQCVVGSGLADCKDGADVGEKMVSKELNSAKLSTATDCAPVVGEEKPDLVSGAVEHLAPVCSSMEEGSASLLAQKSSPTPSVTPVGSGEKLSPSTPGPETATVSTAPECVQVLDIVSQNIWEVSSEGSARSQEQTPPGIVEKRTRPLGEALDEETVTVRAARAIAPVTVRLRSPQAVEENFEYATGVVPTTVLVEQKLSEVCTQLVGRSPSVTPVASGEKLLSLPEQKPGFSEDFSHGDRDSSYNPVWKRPPDNGSKFQGVPPIALGGAINRVSSDAPVFQERRDCRSGSGRILDLVWDAVAQWAIIGQKIEDVCGQGKARSRSLTHLASREKPKIQFSSEKAKVTPTVSAARDCLPVGMGEKLDFVSGAVAPLTLVPWGRNNSPVPNRDVLAVESFVLLCSYKKIRLFSI